jgi:hypothetical protein
MLAALLILDNRLVDAKHALGVDPRLETGSREENASKMRMR